MPRRDVLDPEVERELAALDAALSDAESSSDLAVFARAVRAERPEIDPGFGAKLDAWAASGFASDKAPAARRGTRSRPRRLARPRVARRALLPALGAAASILVALVVVASLVSGGDDGRMPGRVPAPQPTVRGPGSESRQAPAAEPADSLAATAAPPGRARRVERQASLVLTAA